MKTQRQKMNDFEYRHGATAANLEVGFSFQLRALRHSRGWTQKELAKRTGLKQSAISRLESRDVFPTKQTIEKLAKAFDVAYTFRFISFETFMDEAKNLNWERLQVPPYAATAAA